MIVCDTGPLVAAALKDDKHYYSSVELFTSARLAARKLLVPITVVAEVGYLLERFAGPRTEARFIRSLAERDFIPIALDTADFERMAELIEKYADLPLGTTDASVIAVAERLDVDEVATLDRRHFTVVRPRNGAAFSLLPEVL
ncbi:type II toxin-antitoxin system VapC family toxin [Myceligenerans xiligouense]|uniref:Ribonuclease VapC n=1 Tax=Myceligenerans xiligouense TaxID=253184 RepID=A0A3N4YNI8_9MICO|nr:PIN domain-containing protein [Myceligenerans xiligouense]RPF20030.1 hypothetical protein EDD34_0606 [Myceligenerans xiligouense]